MRKFFNYLINIIFPSKCLVCGRILPIREEARVCSQCWENIEFVKPPFCAKCGRPLPAPHRSSGAGFALCFDCSREPPLFGRMRAVGIYNQPLRKCIHLLKYRNKTRLAQPLGQLMVNYMKQYYNNQKFNLLIPVPLHPSRLKERGFNQSKLLAEPISKFFNIPLASHLLKRVQNTRSQFELTKHERQENLKNAFAVTHPELVWEKSILLIDDISTTGTTINECTKPLLASGAKFIWALVLAHGR